MSVNKVILIGNVGKDPEVRYLDTGIAVASFPLATTDPCIYFVEWYTSARTDRMAQSCPLARTGRNCRKVCT